VWQLPGVLFEMGQIYEAYGAFEGALAVYQQIVTTLSFYPKYTEVREAYIGILNLTQAYVIKHTSAAASVHEHVSHVSCALG
jgi:hypothetical protein